MGERRGEETYIFKKGKPVTIHLYYGQNVGAAVARLEWKHVYPDAPCEDTWKTDLAGIYFYHDPSKYV